MKTTRVPFGRSGASGRCAPNRAGRDGGESHVGACSAPDVRAGASQPSKSTPATPSPAPFCPSGQTLANAQFPAVAGQNLGLEHAKTAMTVRPVL